MWVEIIDLCQSADGDSVYVEFRIPSTDEYASLYIPKREINQWLEDTGRLTWRQDWVNESGEHCQLTGHITANRYWRYESRNHEADVRDYIVYNDLLKPVKNESTCQPETA